MFFYQMSILQKKKFWNANTSSWATARICVDLGCLALSNVGIVRLFIDILLKMNVFRDCIKHNITIAQ